MKPTTLKTSSLESGLRLGEVVSERYSAEHQLCEVCVGVARGVGRYAAS